MGDLSNLPPIPAHLKLIPIGSDGSNQAITTLALRRSLLSPFNLNAFVRVANFAQDEAQMPLVVSVDGQRLESHNLDLPPQSSSELVISLPQSAHVLQVSLLDQQGSLSRTDILPIDDRAEADLPIDRPLQVQLVSADPGDLKKVLGRLPGVQVTTADPASYAPAETAEVTILDGFLPADLPHGNLLIIDPQSDGGLFQLQGEIAQPFISSYDLSSPLLASVDLTGLIVPGAAKISLPSWANEVVGADQGPLVFQGVQQGRRIAVFAFSPNQSNLPFRVAFPILVANTVAWLTPAPLPGLVPAEEPVLIRPLPSTSSISVEKPDGATVTLSTDGSPVAFADTNLVGGYKVTYRGPEGDLGTDLFAVNVFDENESRVAPRAYLDSVVEAPPNLAAAPSAGANEIWMWLASLALVLLLAEWWLYNRQGAAAAGLLASQSKARSARLRRP